LLCPRPFRSGAFALLYSLLWPSVTLSVLTCLPARRSASLPAALLSSLLWAGLFPPSPIRPEYFRRFFPQVVRPHLVGPCSYTFVALFPPHMIVRGRTPARARGLFFSAATFCPLLSSHDPPAGSPVWFGLPLVQFLAFPDSTLLRSRLFQSSRHSFIESLRQSFWRCPRGVSA